MTLWMLIQEAMNKNPLGFEKVLKEQLHSRIALALEAKMNDDSVYHDVDWDGQSRVKVMHHNADEITVRRVDKNNKEMAGDDHVTVYTKADPEFREIKAKIQAVDDHNAWKEKRAAALQGRRYHESVEVNEAEYSIGGDVHQSNHADMAQMHREMADKHRRMGGRFNMKAAQEHEAAAKAQSDAANHMYSYERSSNVHTKTHEPSMRAARAVLDKAAAQSKAAFSASHLADAEEKD